MKNLILVWALLFWQQVLDATPVSGIQNAVKTALPFLQAAAAASTILNNSSDLLIAKRNRDNSDKNS
jgi:hypothetical protein